MNIFIEISGLGCGVWSSHLLWNESHEKYETLNFCPSLVAHICLRIWIIGGCGKKATEDLYPSGEWKGEKLLVNDSRRLVSRTELSENLLKYIIGKELGSLDD